MKITRSLSRAATEMEGRSPPSQEDNQVQGEAAIMYMESGSLKLICMRRRSGSRRGSSRSLILWISLVQTMKIQMACKSNMEIGIIPL